MIGACDAKNSAIFSYANENEFIRETELVRGDGSVISVIIKSVLLEDGKTVLVSMVNITDIKNVEKKLKRQNKKLKTAKEKSEESNKLKTEFLNNMSHEIRTPMNAIMGMTDIIIRNDHPSSQDTYLNAIKQSSENLLVILNEILDLSKLEAGKIELEQILVLTCDDQMIIEGLMKLNATANLLGRRLGPNSVQVLEEHLAMFMEQLGLCGLKVSPEFKIQPD